MNVILMMIILMIVSSYFLERALNVFAANRPRTKLALSRLKMMSAESTLLGTTDIAAKAEKVSLRFGSLQRNSISKLRLRGLVFVRFGGRRGGIVRHHVVELGERAVDLFKPRRLLAAGTGDAGYDCGDLPDGFDDLGERAA